MKNSINVFYKLNHTAFINILSFYKLLNVYITVINITVTPLLSFIVALWRWINTLLDIN